MLKCAILAVFLMIGLGVGGSVWGWQVTPHPFAIDWNQHDETVIDLSRYLRAPAGKDGFIRVSGQHFVDGSGLRFRCWGVNITGPSCFPTREQADQLAAALARLGINCVRFHGMDSAWGASSLDRSGERTDSLDLEALERFDYFFYQLKKKGIFSSLNLNVFRIYGTEDGVPVPQDLGLGKWATYFYPRLIELQEKYARDFLGHINPYTETSYLNEPAVFDVEIVNENSLFEGWQMGKLVGQDDGAGDTWSPLPIHYANELNRQFNEWLMQNRSPETVLLFKNEAGVVDDGPLKLLRPDEFNQVSKQRFETDYEFVIEAERRFFSRMKQLIKQELKLQSLLIGDADHNDSVIGYPHILNNQMFDFLDGHGYWQHPSLGASTRTTNTPMVNDPTDSTVVQFARTPMTGIPFVVSETNHPYPHRFAVEGMPILTAYALLQDWDGIVFHEWGRGLYDSTEAIPKTGWFQLSVDPTKIALLYACGLMWHRRDIEAAGKTIVRSYSQEEILNQSRGERWLNRPFFDPSYSLTLPLISQTRWQLVEKSLPAEYPQAEIGGDIVADTGQLRWQFAESGRGRVTIDSPHSQALIGFQKDLRFKNYPGITNVSSNVRNDFAAILLISLDEEPISSSRKILLVVASRAANAGLKWRDDLQTVAEWGDGPVSIIPVTGSLSIWGRDDEPNFAGDEPMVVTPLGPVGERLKATWNVKRSVHGNGWEIEIGDPPAIMAIIERSTAR